MRRASRFHSTQIKRLYADSDGCGESQSIHFSVETMLVLKY